VNHSEQEIRLPLSSLTSKGLMAFRKLIADSPLLSIPQLEQRIAGIASDRQNSKVVAAGCDVSLFPKLTTRLSTAQLVSGILSKAGFDADPSNGHDGMFSWLALVFLPALCRRNHAGTAETGRLYRYILSRASKDFYRHLVACPYWLYRMYPQRSRLFLAQEAFVMPDVVEQIVSRPSLIESQGVVELLDRFYWDETTNSAKAGYTTTIRLSEPPPGFSKTQPGPGTIRALEWTLGQLMCTHDLRSMSAQQIMDKLPPEFLPWLNEQPSKL
jgi:hypothetical protein